MYAAESGISVNGLVQPYLCLKWRGEGKFRSRDYVQGAPTILIGIYIWIRHIRTDVRNLPQPHLGLRIVDGKVYVHRSRLDRFPYHREVSWHKDFENETFPAHSRLR